jgi:hypothetical protein
MVGDITQNELILQARMLHFFVTYVTKKRNLN